MIKKTVGKKNNRHKSKFDGLDQPFIGHTENERPPEKRGTTAQLAAKYRAFIHITYDGAISTDPFAEWFIEPNFVKVARILTGISDEQANHLVNGNYSSLPKKYHAVKSYIPEIFEPSYYLHPLSREAVVQVVARTRFAEITYEDLKLQFPNAQYVSLGAGYDSFGLKNPEAQVIELDQKHIQQHKLSIIQNKHGKIPNNITYNQIDFSKQSIKDILQSADSGYKLNEPSVFSMLGVTPYIEEKEILDTLQQIRAITHPMSTVVFDYLLPIAAVEKFAENSSDDDDKVYVLVRKAIDEVTALRGEPIKTTFTADQLEQAVESIGFKVDEDLDSYKMAERVCGDTGLKLTPVMRYARIRAV